MRAFIVFFSFILLVSCQKETKLSTEQPSYNTTVSNTTPRMDSDGDIVDVHDGRVIKFGDQYYWYGTSYGNTNGFTTANSYHVYSSPDMVSWKKEGQLLPNQPEGVYYRPHVIYNKKNDNYVLWYNWYPQLWDGKFGVAVSDTPTGPFTIVNDDVAMFRSEAGLGDFGLFVDEDETAYISYNTINNHQVSIEKLDADYTGSTMENGGIIDQHMEAGSQFKRGEYYYLLTDYTCCFCNYGSGARVYQSKDPLSGYQLTGNINRKPGTPAPVVTDGISVGTDHLTISKKDSLFDSVQLLWKEEQNISTLTVDIFTGNRPENCGDVSNPRVHPEFEAPEFIVEYWNKTTWQPIEVNQVTSEKTAIAERLTLQINPTEAYRLRVTPVASYKFDRVFINEISSNSNNTPAAYLTGSTIPQRPIIPAQQTYVMELPTADGTQFLWMGDMWGSASDNIKGHDYQYWSAPLEFRKDGTIVPLEWNSEWGFNNR